MSYQPFHSSRPGWLLLRLWRQARIKEYAENEGKNSIDHPSRARKQEERERKRKKGRERESERERERERERGEKERLL
jgi:hypothetical protein